MPRRPKDPADEFSHSDLAVAVGTTKRAIQIIADNSGLPGDRSIRDLKRACVIGAFVSAGVPLLVASRVVEKLLWNFDEADGEFPSRLHDFDSKLDWSDLPTDLHFSDYWRHRKLVTRRDLYQPGEALKLDYRVIIADSERVFTSYGTSMGGDPAYAGRIEGWARNSDVSFIVPTFDPEAEWSRGAPPDDEPQLKFLRNAMGILTINTSLAIRNGLDRIARHRGLLRRYSSEYSRQSLHLAPGS